jgi:hypothetical protein
MEGEFSSFYTESGGTDFTFKTVRNNCEMVGTFIGKNKIKGTVSSSEK